MAETEYKRLLQSAQDRAQIGFLAAAQRAMQDADKNIVETLAKARSGLDHSALTGVRHFIRQDGNVFLRCIDTRFRASLERAMQTMFVDLRPGMRKLTADELSLIDDEAVNHQIEVGRLAERMRDANEESIGRLNVIIAQIHGHHEAKERENPFRPYLLARALYEAIKETAADEANSRMLFDHIANALVPHLPGYYQSIRDVFEASGLRGKFTMQRSRHAHTQRYFGAPGAGNDAAAQFSAKLMPGLQRILEAMQNIPAGMNAYAGAAPGAVSGENPATVQDFLRKMFVPSRSFFPPGSEPPRARSEPVAPVNSLVRQLSDYQSAAAREEAPTPQANATPPRLAQVCERMDLQKASVMERMTVDVVAMLFDIILDDEQIPAELRRHIGRLQIPILKAAVIEPELMHDETHPARLLLNRMSSAAVSVDPASPDGARLAAEFDRIVSRILAEFDADVSIFADTLQQFESFLVDFVRHDDSRATQAIEAVEAAEKFSILLSNTMDALCEVLLPLNADKRISDFVIRVWPHVLVHAAWKDVESRTSADGPESLAQQYRNVLPELLWSIQEKQNPADRAALMRMLPGLVKRFRDALNLIQLPDDEAKEMLDTLIELHTQVLRGVAKTKDAETVSLDELRQPFARLVVSWERVTWSLADPPQPRASVIEDVFGKRGVVARQHLDAGIGGTSAADRDFLAQTYLLGTRVQFMHDGAGTPGQLVWISTHRSLYLFRQENDAGLVLFSFASLLDALREEMVLPLEYAPVFERAVESLLFGAGKLQDMSV
ncbi:DUF1631 family protein [Noviherbaspirillum saxi]|uniref:DUF1631 family protein n=1 Tax=Noviherbaspirillum saxi TaxID=2320863 RepID=A0A3A3G3W2_9BURK|nr:DUF1631 family protein [Noviherbaspirillum saxi]RJF96106.1 DUF1631 family protein [Noviherbaspirillum saxi]